ncbi:MAG: hypothetical protein R3C56_32920 [Pirellulaceae bacterium]
MLASELERKEIYVVTDLMSASWLASTGGLTELLGAHVEDVLLQVIDVGAKDHVNFRLGDPLVDFDTVPAGGEVAIEIDVHRPDNTAGEGLNIELHQEQVDSKSPPIISDGKLQITNVKVVDRQVAEFGSSETARVTLRASDLVAGSHNATIRLDRPDPLLVDNQRFLTVLAQQQRPTLMRRRRRSPLVKTCKRLSTHRRSLMGNPKSPPWINPLCSVVERALGKVFGHLSVRPATIDRQTRSEPAATCGRRGWIVPDIGPQPGDAREHPGKSAH